MRTTKLKKQNHSCGYCGLKMLSDEKVHLHLGKLKDRLKQLCDLHGIRFQET